MKNKKYTVFPVTLMILAAGTSCMFTEEKTEATTGESEKRIQKNISLVEAEKLKKNGKFWEAVKICNMIRAETMNIIEDRKASICAAECFIRMRDYDLALKALVPLKENPASLQERQKMSLAGEIFLRKNMPEKAEPFLETALAGLNGKYLESLWGASTLANLGKAYAMNRKITKALNVFKKAQAAFALNKKNSEAGKCAKISGALRNIIESYKNAIR